MKAIPLAILSTIITFFITILISSFFSAPVSQAEFSYFKAESQKDIEYISRDLKVIKKDIKTLLGRQ